MTNEQQAIADEVSEMLDRSAERYRNECKLQEEQEPTICDCIKNAKEWLDTAINLQMVQYQALALETSDISYSKNQNTLDALQQMIRVRQLMRGLS